MDIKIKNNQRLAIIGSGAVGLNIHAEMKRLFGDNIHIDIADSNDARAGETCAAGIIKAVSSLVNNYYDLIILGYRAEESNYQKHRKKIGSLFSCPVKSAVELFATYPGIRGWPLLDSTIANKKKPEFDFITYKLFDAESKNQYRAYYNWICQVKGSSPVIGTNDDQYFPNKIIKLTDSEVFVDCGAYIGDTLNSFLIRTKGVFCEYYAIEPDVTNFDKLSAFAATLPRPVRSRIRLYNSAISSDAGYLNFSACGTEKSHMNFVNHMNSVSPEWVWCTSLSRISYRLTPTFIKLDLEGSDLSALRGGAAEISKWRPVICAAIYHNPSDFLDIPLFLMSCLDDYKFYVRSHNIFGLDFVIYCVPEC